jgi:hypothetical protein
MSGDEQETNATLVRLANQMENLYLRLQTWEETRVREQKAETVTTTQEVTTLTPPDSRGDASLNAGCVSRADLDRTDDIGKRVSTLVRDLKVTSEVNPQTEVAFDNLCDLWQRQAIGFGYDVEMLKYV